MEKVVFLRRPPHAVDERAEVLTSAVMTADLLIAMDAPMRELFLTTLKERICMACYRPHPQSVMSKNFCNCKERA